MKIGAIRISNDLVLEDIECDTADFDRLVDTLGRLTTLIQAATHPAGPHP